MTNPKKEHWATAGSRRGGRLIALVLLAPIAVLLILFLRACS